MNSVPTADFKICSGVWGISPDVEVHNGPVSHTTSVHFSKTSDARMFE
jgi:hypothetical protein